MFSTHLENFLPFSSKNSFWKSLKFVIWERVNDPKKNAFKNILGEGENTGDQHFPFSSHYIFSPFKHKSHHCANIVSPAIVHNLGKYRIFSQVKS